MKIHEDSLTLLGSSSTDGVALSMNRVAAGLSGEHWLPQGHRYRRRRRHGRWKGGHGLLRSDLSTGNVRNDELSEYIGVSAPVHSMDGWSLLGRAIHCLLRGDPYSAVHLAYYAELRAAVAILASQGIGVFNNPHCVIDSDGCCKLVEPVDQDMKQLGNHQWTWLVFQWWSREQRAVELLRKVIRPNGESLGTWVDEMDRARFALEGIGPRWLELWGIDIGRYFADRAARNDASYWPNTINNWEPRTALENYKVVSDIWLTLEPTPEARFAQLDRHLLRIVLTDGYFGATSERRTSETGQRGFGREVESLLRSMGIPDRTRPQWRDFLTSSSTSEPAVIRMANGKARVGDSSHVVEVMSRAIMLLRLSAGASAALLSNAGIEREDLEFWIQAVGTGRGIWQSQEPPDELVDLWTDVDYELEQIDSWIDEGDSSAQEMWGYESKSLAVLGECERVALWGLGL